MRNLPEGLPSMTALDALFEGRPETLDPADVAEILGMTKQGVYNWLKNGTIPGYKMGSSWFIIRDELKAQLAKGSNREITETDEQKE